MHAPGSSAARRTADRAPGFRTPARPAGDTWAMSLDGSEPEDDGRRAPSAPPHPWAGVTAATQFSLRGLAEGAFAGVATGLLSGAVVHSTILLTENILDVSLLDGLMGYYVFALYGAMFGAPLGVTFAALLLVAIGLAVAGRRGAARWQGWPWVAAIAVATVVAAGLVFTDGFIDELVINVSLPLIAGLMTAWRCRATVRWWRARSQARVAAPAVR